MASTVLGRKMLDFEAGSQGKDNFICCNDKLILFEHLHENLDAFEFAHKTGVLPHTFLDTGIMYLRDPIFVALFS
ncbi:MAG: class A beta-lactamase-related serine hydrolase [Treponema sp.]|jgi:hypothetical protein|nr:class A beta-lactamase-related serine hydrolase [Treponema sp.]